MLYKTYKETAGRGKIAARVATVRAALSAVITDDVDEADRLDVLEGCHRVLGDAMGSTWTAWVRFDQGEMQVSGGHRKAS